VKRALTFSAVVLLAAQLLPAHADIVTLKSGQVFEGKVAESDDTVDVAMPNFTVSFNRSEVAGIKYGPTPEEIYLQRAADLAGDDAEGWYNLGLYAAGKALADAAREAFNRALEAEPEHEGARRELGFVRDNGEWITLDESMRRKGYKRFRGRWVSAEEAERLKAEAQTAGEAAAARHRVKTLAFVIVYGTAEKSAAAREELSSTNAPAAFAALVGELSNDSPLVRTAILNALVNYGDDDAALAALEVAMWDPDRDVRFRARRVLSGKQNEAAFRGAIAFFAWNHDETRFAAAEVLGSIGDLRAIPHLIDYLSWTRPGGVRREPSPRRRRRGDGVVPTWIVGYRAKVAPGVVAYEPVLAGRDRGEIVIIDPDRTDDQGWEDFPSAVDEMILNYEALEALRALTGEDFGFDKNAWANWYLANQARLAEFPAPAPPRNEGGR
jgi:3-deoxy-D-manno-octulosonate 8-phosphate phosphatase KdsC-like HAD superfamily phosphatase